MNIRDMRVSKDYFLFLSINLAIRSTTSNLYFNFYIIVYDTFSDERQSH
jgi:hypothetical protein